MSYFKFSPLKIRILLVLALFAAIFLTASLGATHQSTGSDNSSYLLREGTKLDNTSGFFQSAGERTVFFMEKEKRRLICLENLALQRVNAQAANGNWRVRGTITEYNGENYLLIEMAVMTSARQ